MRRRFLVPFLIVLFLAAAVAFWRTRGPVQAPAAVPVSAPVSATVSAPASAPRALSREQLQRMVEETQSTLKVHPDDVASWALLAHSREMLGQFDEAAKAFAKLAELRPEDAQVFADYADALAVAQGRRLDGQPQALIARALQIDPDNVKALVLEGTSAFGHQQFAHARQSWEKARRLSKDADVQAQLDRDIAAAEARASGAGASAPAAASEPASAAAVSGRLTLASALQSRVKPTDTVILFARPASGSRMPLALTKLKVADLPLAYRLDGSNAMVPGTSLATAGEVVIGARVSRRGDAIPAAGDLQGFSAAVRPGASGVAVEISEVVK